MPTLSQIRCAAVAAMALALSLPLSGQNVHSADAKMGIIIGTVSDVNHDTIANATVVLEGADSEDRHTIVTSENGFFEFHHIKPGSSYQIRVRAKDFADWTSPTFALEAGQFKILPEIQLPIAMEHTAVNVTYDPAKVAAEQFKIQETQLVFGILPNFYVAYDPNAEPLTTKMKFKLALKVSTDPVTAAGVAVVSAFKQAANSPKYGQGWGAYGERFGATAADGFSDIMIGGAILPSLLHQDPRYFYQGTGTTGSRIRHAVFSTVVARGDNRSWQPNYSTIGGDLSSAALANLYYPRRNRGVGLVFGNFGIATAERVAANLAQEFVLGKITRRGGPVN
jgi:hypothetical protein